jgi:hypothetical protein
MDESDQMSEDRRQFGILPLAEYHEATSPVESWLYRECPSPMQLHEPREGGRLKLLSVFQVLNHPPISDV